MYHCGDVRGFGSLEDGFLWSPVLVPGLLQVERYARALVSAEGHNQERVEALVTLRLERHASKIMVYEPQQVPDLLQHQDYSKAVAGVRAGVPKNSALLRLAEVRKARQDLVLRAKQTEMAVVLGEGALRQSPADQHVLRAQLTALTGARGKFPNLSLQILPFASGSPVAAGAAPFTIFCYAETSLSVVYLPGFSGGTFCIGEDDITSYTLAFAQLKASALTEPASVRMISTADPSPRMLYAANRA